MGGTATAHTTTGEDIATCGRGTLRPRPSPRLTPKLSHGGTATTATAGTGATPAPTGTGGDTPTAHTTEDMEATATCGRGMLRPTPRLTGTETGTAGGGEAGDTDTGLTATDTTAAGGGGRSIHHHLTA